MDSIKIWLQKGKNRTLPFKARQEFLTKAESGLQQELADTLRLYYISQLSIGYRRLDDSIAFRNYNTKLQNLAMAMDNKRELANAHWDLAAFFNGRSVRDSSFYHYFQAHSLFREIRNDKYSGRMLYFMAVQQQKARAYVESEKTTYDAIEILEPIQDTTRLFLCYNNLGTVTKELEEYDRSLAFFDMAASYVELMKEEDKAASRRTLDNNLGNLYKEQELWDKAIPFFEAALDYENLETERPRAYAQTLNNLAFSKLQNGAKLDILEDFNKALNIYSSENDPAGVSSTYYNLAAYYIRQDEKEKALSFADRAIELAESSMNYERKLETYKLLHQFAPDHDRIFDDYVALSERLQKEERLVRDKFARIERETDQALSKAESEARGKQVATGISIGLFLLGLAAFIIIYQRVRVQRLRFQQQQQESNQEIFNLMLAQKQKMEEGKQSEQKRISEELHDGVLGAMNGIRMVLLGLNKKSDESSMSMREEAIEKLKEVQEEIRSISHELNHAAYQKFSNFISSIKELIKETTASTGLEITFNYDEDVEWDALNGETKINLYRIIQESLQNIVKHAKATQVEIDFEYLAKMLKINVVDNGQGFDVKKAKKGIGQKNIKSRVSKLNGTWNVESSLGKGTHITVILPYIIEQHEQRLLVNEAGQLQEVKKD